MYSFFISLILLSFLYAVKKIIQQCYSIVNNTTICLVLRICNKAIFLFLLGRFNSEFSKCATQLAFCDVFIKNLDAVKYNTHSDQNLIQNTVGSAAIKCRTSNFISLFFRAGHTRQMLQQSPHNCSLSQHSLINTKSKCLFCLQTVTDALILGWSVEIFFDRTEQVN